MGRKRFQSLSWLFRNSDCCCWKIGQPVSAGWKDDWCGHQVGIPSRCRREISCPGQEGARGGSCIGINTQSQISGGSSDVKTQTTDRRRLGERGLLSTEQITVAVIQVRQQGGDA